MLLTQKTWGASSNGKKLKNNNIKMKEEMKYNKIEKNKKNNMYSIRLSDEHSNLLKASAVYNSCGRAKVVEDALNKYFNLNNEIVND